MNQNEKMKIYEQQKQRADKDRKRQLMQKYNEKKVQLDALDKAKRQEPVNATKKQGQLEQKSVTKKQVQVEQKSVTKKQVQVEQKSTPKKQVEQKSTPKRQVEQKSTPKRQVEQKNVTKKQVQAKQKSAPRRQVQLEQKSNQQQLNQATKSQVTEKRQLEQGGVRKQNKQLRSNTRKQVAPSNRTQQAQRIAMRNGKVEKLRAKKGPKAKNISMEDVVKKVVQVSQDVKEGIQGAVYYIGVTLEKAKEREEREERDEVVWNDSNVQRHYTRVDHTKQRTVPQNTQTLTANTDRTNQTISNQQTAEVRKRHFGNTNLEIGDQKQQQSVVKNWIHNLKKGKRMELLVTASAAMLVLVVGGSIISGIGNTSENAEDNPIRNLINMMDFVNGKDKEDSSKPQDVDTEKETLDIEIGDNQQTGITGNYTITTASGKVVDISRILCPSWIDRQFLTVNQYSRPGVILDKIESIVIHYVGNAGTTAQNNRDYFENLKDTHEASKSSHFVVGLNGEVIQCIPLNEKSYASNHRNSDTISIEVCHLGEDGKFSDVTYDSVVKLTAWLCQNFGLEEENIIRHFDVTGKSCPKYFVDHPEEWRTFKSDVMDYMKQNPDIK